MISLADTSKSFVQRLNVNITRARRIALFFFFLAVFFVAMSVGAFASLSASDAQAISNNIQSVRNQPLLSRFETVVLNDGGLCLLFFIPGVGQVLLVYASYQTGVSIAALAITDSVSRVTELLNVLFFPTALLDGIVFGLAASEGFIFLLSIINKRYRAESKRFIITIIVCLAVLVVSEVILVLAYGLTQSPTTIIP